MKREEGRQGKKREEETKREEKAKAARIAALQRDLFLSSFV
jgi:hypothetical protein